jgi:hypothetical protein
MLSEHAGRSVCLSGFTAAAAADDDDDDNDAGRK